MKRLLIQLFLFLIIYTSIFAQRPVNGWMLTITKNCTTETEIVEGIVFTGEMGLVQRFTMNIIDPSKESYVEWMKIFDKFQKPSSFDYWLKLDTLGLSGPYSNWTIFHEFYVGNNSGLYSLNPWKVDKNLEGGWISPSLSTRDLPENLDSLTMMVLRIYPGAGGSVDVISYSFDYMQAYYPPAIILDSFGDDITSVKSTEELSETFELSQNYPNPFNPLTEISFFLPKVSDVKLIIYNSIGEEIEKLVDEVLYPGIHTKIFENKMISSGVYFYSLITDEIVITKKMLMLK